MLDYMSINAPFGAAPAADNACGVFGYDAMLESHWTIALRSRAFAASVEPEGILIAIASRGFFWFSD
jgi:hypothetical protein